MRLRSRPDVPAGVLDLAVLDPARDRICVFLTETDDTPRQSADVALTQPHPVGLIAADLTARRTLDLVVVHEQACSFSHLVGVGDGTFRSPTTVEVSARRIWMVTVGRSCSSSPRPRSTCSA